MRTSIQILFGFASFAAVFFIGLLFDHQFWQAGIHFEKLFDDEPLPKITEVFVSSLWLANLLLSLPWFVLLGFPLAVPAGERGFRSPASFVLRYLAFLSIELFLVFVLVLARLMPFIPYYPLMRSPETSWTELIPAISLGLAGVVLLVAIVRCQRDAPHLP